MLIIIGMVAALVLAGLGVFIFYANGTRTMSPSARETRIRASQGAKAGSKRGTGLD